MPSIPVGGGLNFVPLVHDRAFSDGPLCNDILQMDRMAWRREAEQQELTHPLMSKLKSPRPATMQPDTMSNTEAVISCGGACFV